MSQFNWLQNLWCKISWNPECCLLIIPMLMVTHTKGIWKKPFENINLSLFVTVSQMGDRYEKHIQCVLEIESQSWCITPYNAVLTSPVRHRDWWSARQQYHTHRGEQLGRNGSHYIRRRWVFELQHLKSRPSHKTETAKKTLIFHTHHNFFCTTATIFSTVSYKVINFHNFF